MVLATCTPILTHMPDCQDVSKPGGHIVRKHLEEADFPPEMSETLHKGQDLPGYNLI